MTSADQPATKKTCAVNFRRSVDCALGAGRHIHDRHDEMELRHQKPAARQAASESDAAGSIRFRLPDSVHEKFWNTKLQHLHCGSFRHRRHDDFSPAVSGDYETVSACKNQTTCRACFRNRSMDFLTGILIRGFSSCTAQLIFSLFCGAGRARLQADPSVALHLQVEARVQSSPLHHRIAQRLHALAQGRALVWPSVASEFSPSCYLAGLP